MIRQDWSSLKKLLFFQMAAGGGAAVEATATGNPLTFVTDLAKPLKSLLIPFTPQQEGTGDPSPSNIRPLLPWNGLTVWKAGANLADFTIIQGGIDGATGAENQSPARIKTKDAFFIKGGGTKYIIDAKGVDKVWIYNYDADGTYSASQDLQGFKSLPCTYTRNGADCRLKLAFCMNDQDQRITPSVISEIRFQVGTTLSPFETADVTENPIAFPDGQSVYGGTLDVVSGVLTVTMVARVFDGSSDEQWGGSSGARQVFPIQWADVRGAQLDGKRVIVCNQLIPSTNIGDNPSYGYIYNTTSEYNIRTHLVNEDITQAQFRQLLAENPLVVVCPLVTPQTIQLTGQQITALVGDNTIWSDANGQMTATYLKKG